VEHTFLLQTSWIGRKTTLYKEGEDMRQGTIFDKIDSRPDYARLWRTLDDWPSPETAKEEYVAFASSFLQDERLEMEPDALRCAVDIFIALGQVSANEPVEAKLEELGAPKEWARIYETQVEHVLEEPEAQVGPLASVLRQQLEARGYKVGDEALEALCAIEVALHRP
jgi:hypothetical protein